MADHESTSEPDPTPASDPNPDSGATRTGDEGGVPAPAEGGESGPMEGGSLRRGETDDGVNHSAREVQDEINNTGGGRAGLTERSLVTPPEDGGPESQVEEMEDPNTRSEVRQTQDRVADDSSVSVPVRPPGSGTPERLSAADLEELDQDPELRSESNDGLGDSPDRPFDHLRHAKYGTVSYRQIQRGQTKRRIKEFESMMQF